MSQSERYDELMDILRARRSIRRYDASIIPTEEEVIKMVFAAHLAPSAGNSRNRRFIAVFSDDIKLEMRKAVEDKISYILSKINSARARDEFEKYSKAYYTFFNEAPLVFAVVMKPYDSLSRRIIKMYGITDVPSTSSGIQGVAAAIENLLLAATSLGYASCWMTGPLIARSELEKILRICPPEELFALVPVGKPLTQKVGHGKSGLSSEDTHSNGFALPDGVLDILK